MFRIRRIYDNTIKRDSEAIAQVQSILQSQFSALKIDEIEKLPSMLRDPLKYRFRTILFVADDYTRNVKGFAILNHDHELNFCFLDFLSTHPQIPSRGIGGALYERVREEAQELGSIGIFFEC
ncbi:MAG: GNAT family N-acetyltransferase, partial [Spirochaetes bacterium]|nr:GNAT family N-acetyltransferase [Spirochaetota bacterium]